MTPQTLEQQLTKYLTDMHSIEQQALAQMKVAPKLAGEEQIAQAFSTHLTETVEHERLVRECLKQRDAKPARLKDLAGTLTGAGFAAFAASQPDTPGKLVAHAYSYEHMEQAGYRVVVLLAQRLGEERVLGTATRIEGQERAMGQRLERLFERAVEVALPHDAGQQLDKYLADAHAIEAQATRLLSKGRTLAGTDALATLYDEHLRQTEDHSRMLESRLSARGSSPSRIKDAALKLGALNWGMFFAAQPDTPVKLACFAYAFEHLEIAGYELLRRVAQRAQDTETSVIAEQILAEERAAAEKLQSLLGEALDASLQVSVAAGPL